MEPDTKELVSPPPSPNYGSRHSPNVMKTLTNMKRSFEESAKETEKDVKGEDKVSSGIESEVTSTTESEPPHKFYIGEDMTSGEKVSACMFCFRHRDHFNYLFRFFWERVQSILQNSPTIKLLGPPNIQQPCIECLDLMRKVGSQYGYLIDQILTVVAISSYCYALTSNMLIGKYD